MSQNKPTSGFHVQTSQNEAIVSFRGQTSLKNKATCGFQIKPSQNEAKMVFMFKGVKNEAIGDFHGQMSQKQTYKWFPCSNESK